MMTVQTLRASQKQPTIFQIKKWILLGETNKETLPWYKNISPGFKKFKEAIKGTYVDKKRPFTDNISTGGLTLSGVATKMKMQRPLSSSGTISIYTRKSSRFENHHENMSVHLSSPPHPCFRDVQTNDIVTMERAGP
ncbi:40S ribosomal protein S11-like [Microtus oregoni]|uniref:40S ribosomal protein S11-like n=1 Tax=Microtus oregoni TaxID=111838 RepID=UPI001BB1E998|nr:40S ribosomal protein S11-like [Microtus oregoni]